MRKHRRQDHAEASGEVVDRAHAPGKRRLFPPRTAERAAKPAPATRMHDQPWVPTSGLVGRSRRSARRS
jgi:hypothetical protein